MFKTCWRHSSFGTQCDNSNLKLKATRFIIHAPCCLFLLKERVIRWGWLAHSHACDAQPCRMDTVRDLQRVARGHIFWLGKMSMWCWIGAYRTSKSPFTGDCTTCYTGPSAIPIHWQRSTICTSTGSDYTEICIFSGFFRFIYYLRIIRTAATTLRVQLRRMNLELTHIIDIDLRCS